MAVVAEDLGDVGNLLSRCVDGLLRPERGDIGFRLPDDDTKVGSVLLPSPASFPAALPRHLAVGLPFGIGQAVFGRGKVGMLACDAGVDVPALIILAPDVSACRPTD